MCRGCRFNRDTSGWDVSQVTNMNTIFYGNYSWFTGRGVHTWNLAGLNASNALDNFCYTTTLPTGQYDLILNNWNTNKASGVNGVGDWRNDLRPHFGGSKYTSASSSARQSLINYGKSKNIDYANEPCAFECGLDYSKTQWISPEESIKNNHWIK